MTILEQLRAKRAEIYLLADKYHVSNIRVFGSVARGEETQSSDIDILVSPLAGCTYFELGGLLIDMQEMFNKKVDIVSDRGISKYIKDDVLKEAVPL